MLWGRVCPAHFASMLLEKARTIFTVHTPLSLLNSFKDLSFAPGLGFGFRFNSKAVSFSFIPSILSVLVALSPCLG